MIQLKVKEICTCLRRWIPRACKLATYAGSVALLVTLCKAAYADEPEVETSGFKLGGYSSSSITAPLHGGTELRIDDVSLMLRWENDSRLKFFGELELERPLVWNEDKHFNSKNTYLDLERLYLDYNLSDKVNIRTGRFLTPAGRWNLLHAAPLVWTATRPLATSYLFPTAVNGLMLHGSIPYETKSQNQALEYSFFVEALKDQIRDNNEIIYKNVAGAHFTFTNQFNLGLSLAAFTEDKPAGPDYRMLGLDFKTHIKGWELSGEGFQRFTSSGNDGGSGAYLQSAAPLGNNWFWLTRLETLHQARQGSAHVSGERWVMGLTKRIAPQQLLKMEFVGGSDNFTDTPRGFVGSFAVLF
jgi:hypothetical protein